MSTIDRVATVDCGVADCGWRGSPHVHDITPARVRAERLAEEEAEAEKYAQLLRSGSNAVAWPEVNAEIINRWSESALKRIKRRAWTIVSRGDAR